MPLTAQPDVYTNSSATARLPAAPSRAILSIAGVDSFVAFTIAPIAAGWSNRLPGEDFTH